MTDYALVLKFIQDELDAADDDRSYREVFAEIASIVDANR